jgi:hypothetical protein
MLAISAMREQMLFDPNLRYLWRPLVLGAILELDPEHKLAKIISAERAISIRLVQRSADEDEQLALQYASCALKVVQRVP